MITAEAIKANKYMTKEDIDAHLEGVEYIIMAAPNPDNHPQSPIHFSIFLNTSDVIPQEIQHQIIQKFADQYKITNIANMFSQLDDVAFALTNIDTPMPMHLFKEDDKNNFDSVKLHIIDFLADSEGFNEPKQGQTGWSYSYA